MSRFKRIACLLLTCIIAINIHSSVLKAATRQADWSLYFNPTQPSYTWVLSQTPTFVSSNGKAKLYLTSITRGSRVKYKVLNHSSTFIFSTANNFEVYNLPVGITLYASASFDSYENVVTRAAGYVYA